MQRRSDTKSALRAEIAALRDRLEEAEQTLDALRSGHVDALVVHGDEGEQIFTLKGADHSYRRMVETMSEGAANVSADGTLLFCNSRFAEMLETPLERLIGASIMALLPEEARPAFDVLLGASGETRTLKSVIDLRTSKGNHVPVHLSVMAAGKQEGGGACLVATDLTGSRLLEREQVARAEAEAAHRRFAFLAEAGSLLAATLDYEKTLQSATRLALPTLGDFCFLDIFGSETHHERVARAYKDSTVEARLSRVEPNFPPLDSLFYPVLHIPSKPPAQAPLSASTSRRGAASSPGGSAEDLSGELRSIISVPLIVRKKAIGALIMGFTLSSTHSHTPADLSLAEEYGRRVALAIDQARLYQESQQVSRAKDEFLATLSHELRTPLTAIMGWIRMLRTMELSKPTMERGLETIERNARAQGKLIEDLLDVSRVITGKLQLNVRAIELLPVVEAALDVIRPAAEAKGIRIESYLRPCAVIGDPDRLQQVFWNLLVNAVKFTPEKGRIYVKLRCHQGQAELSVTDTGIGISAEFLPQVFDRFSQADGSTTRVHGGLGIGLALVRHMVELHGGLVRVESPGHGHGTTFFVWIPALNCDAVVDGEASAFVAGQSAPRMLSSLHVLIVEDDTDAREFLGEALSQWGAEVTLAGAVDEALLAMDRHVPDVLVSDIAMPGKDGYALIRAVRARSRKRGGQIPAVALTAYASSKDRLRVIDEGFQIHIAKPIEPSELVTVIARLTVAREEEPPISMV